MKRIIYFDTWTRGIKNYSYIDSKIKNNYETFLLHVESKIVPYFSKDIDISWYSGKKVDFIDGIECRDISFYASMKLVDILKLESPELVIMLSLSHIQNRVMTEACKKLGIKIVFMMHGAILSHAGNKILAKDLKKSNRYKLIYKIKKYQNLYIFYINIILLVKILKKL